MTMTPERIAELRELARRDHTKGCDMRCAACSCGYENDLEAAVPLMLDHIDAQAATIARAIAIIEHCDVTEGVCCCGDDMATHAEPMSCGHTPVDAGHYHHGNAIQQARDAIEHGAGK